MEDKGVFYNSLKFILEEIVNGPPEGEAYLLNPGDPGLLRQIDKLDPVTASTRPMKGLTTVASHVAHVLYGFTLVNRWAEGEEDPWKDADWEQAWKKTVVTAVEWELLKFELRSQITKWQSELSERKEWSDIEARGAAGVTAHTAYHLGAIRQILAAMDRNDAPK